MCADYKHLYHKNFQQTKTDRKGQKLTKTDRNGQKQAEPNTNGHKKTVTNRNGHKKTETNRNRQGGGATERNERRPSQKIARQGDRQIPGYTDIATYRLNRPSGSFSENISTFCR